MKKLTLTLLLLVGASHLPSLGKTIHLAVGQTQQLPIAAKSPIGLGDGKIVKLRDEGSWLYILGSNPGRTWLQVGQKRFQIVVSPSATSIFFESLTKSVQKMRGLKASLGPQGVKVTGTLLRLADWKQLKALAIQHDQPFEMQVKLHPSIERKTKNWLQALINQHGVPSHQLLFQPEIKIDLMASQSQKAKNTIEQLSRYGLKVTLNQQRVEQLPSVQLEIVIAEVDKTFERELGIRWGDTGKYTAQVLPQSRWGVLNAQLSALEAQGTGQILARPRLLSRSGERAEFHAGGEIPIRISGWGAQNVQWKKHGIIMNFQPEADHFGAMRLQVEVEISIPNLSQMVGQLPTFETNRVKSQFDLSEKRTIVLSGLVRKSQSQSSEGLPFLSQIPVLGRLFGSPRFQSRETELIVFVTPEVLSLESLAGPPKLPKGMKSQ